MEYYIYLVDHICIYFIYRLELSLTCQNSNLLTAHGDLVTGAAKEGILIERCSGLLNMADWPPKRATGDI